MRGESFVAKVSEAAERNGGSRLCVGLDPDDRLVRVGAEMVACLRTIVEATRDLVCCYKVNLAFYEVLGMEGMSLLTDVLAAIGPDIPVIGDAKRGDVSHAMARYARALFDFWGFDAATVNLWGGEASIAPFRAYRDRGVLVWGVSEPHTYTWRGQIASYAFPGCVRRWNTYENLGLTASAVNPVAIAWARHDCPEELLLIPGVGAQNGSVHAAVAAAAGPCANGRKNHMAPFIVSASRSICQDERGILADDVIRAQAVALRDEIATAWAFVAADPETKGEVP